MEAKLWKHLGIEYQYDKLWEREERVNPQKGKTHIYTANSWRNTPTPGLRMPIAPVHNTDLAQCFAKCIGR